MSPTFFSLGFVIKWFHTKLSPSHFTTKLRLWVTGCVSGVVGQRACKNSLTQPCGRSIDCCDRSRAIKKPKQRN